jgi:hypothetical protein
VLSALRACVVPSRDFLCQLCMSYVENKYKCELSKKYKLPKLKYQVSMVEASGGGQSASVGKTVLL